MRNTWILSLCTMFATPVFASVELRGNYGMTNAKPDAFNGQIDHSVKGAPDIEAPRMMGLDAIYVSMMRGLNAGLRYETGTFKKTGPATLGGTAVTATTEYAASRVSLLGGMRFINTPAGYVGALAHYAISQSGEFTRTVTNAVGAKSTSKYKGEMDGSYGVGLEAGARVKHLVVGAEAGYTISKVKSFSDSDGVVLDPTDLSVLKMDLSGIYLKASIGYAF